MGRHPASRGLGGWKGFAAGIVASVVIETVAPHLTKSAGPAARNALRFLFRVSDEVGRAGARAREQVEDFVASTRAEYDAEQESAPSNGQNSPEATS